jgi:hypothetical protein
VVRPIPWRVSLIAGCVRGMPGHPTGPSDCSDATAQCRKSIAFAGGCQIRSDATLRAYAADLASYKARCKWHGFDPVQATPEIACGTDLAGARDRALILADTGKPSLEQAEPGSCRSQRVSGTAGLDPKRSF